MKKTLGVLMAVGLAATALSACQSSGGGGSTVAPLNLPEPTVTKGDGVLAPNGPNGYTVTVGQETFTFSDSAEIDLGQGGERDAASAAAVQNRLTPARGAAIFAVGTGFGDNETPVVEDVYLALSGVPTDDMPQNQMISYVGEYEITTLAIGEDPDTSEGLFKATANFATGTGTLTGEFFAGSSDSDPKTADLNGTIAGSDFTGDVSGTSPEGEAIALDVKGGFFGKDAETVMGGGTGMVGAAAAAGVFVGDDVRKLP